MKDDVDFSRYIMARIDLRKIWLLSCFPSQARAFTLTSAVFGIGWCGRLVAVRFGPISLGPQLREKVSVSVRFVAI